MAGSKTEQLSAELSSAPAAAPVAALSGAALLARVKLSLQCGLCRRGEGPVHTKVSHVHPCAIKNSHDLVQCNPLINPCVKC